MTAAATLTDVSVHFREHTALDGVTASIERDGITGLLGRNGAGKTTLLQLLAGHRVPTRGQVRVLGAAPYENDDVLRRVCFVKEGQRYPDHFRVRDALAAAATLFPGWDEDLARSLVDGFGLPPRRPVKKLSRGMVSAVGITIGLASRAPVTLFDEPYLGLDAVARQLFYDELLADYAEFPRTIVLSTHLIEEISGLLEHVLLIDAGRVLLDDDADGLRGTALTVTGPADRVAALAREHELLSTDTLGGSGRAIVRLRRPVDPADLSPAGLTAERTPLQELVVALTTRPAPAPAPAARSTGTRSDHRQEATR
jgi:ABC-2 type transport system ATP-binding protein